MKFRAILAVLALAIGAWNVRAADDENPYKKAKVGDYIKYSLNMTVAGVAIPGSAEEVVKEKGEKEATVELTMNLEFMGQKLDLPAQKSTIDLTKPYDPLSTGAGLGDAKLEKLKDGKETIKAGDGKKYDCTWTTYKAKIKAMGQEVEGELKAWTSKDLPIGMVKMVFAGNIGDQKMEIAMDYKEAGSKKDKEGKKEEKKEKEEK